jgi:hypothetical protein
MPTWYAPSAFAVEVDAGGPLASRTVASLLSAVDGDRLMLVEATVLSPVLALAWYAGGGAEPPFEPAGADPSRAFWSALSASQRRDSCVGLRDMGGEPVGEFSPPGPAREGVAP